MMNKKWAIPIAFLIGFGIMGGLFYWRYLNVRYIADVVQGTQR